MNKFTLPVIALHWNRKGRIRTTVLKNMSLVRFRFSILRYTWAFSIFVPAAHKPTVSYILDSILIFCLFYKIVGEDGVEPPEPLSNWFTASTATPTEYSPRTRTPRVSNDFFVLCFPLDCFMLCQSHRVVSDIIMPFDFMLLENSLVINARLWWLIETKKHLSDGKSDQAQAYAVTYLCSFWFTYAHPKVFSAHKTDG